MRLDQLGTVTDATAEPRTFAALDGAPVVAFAISRAKGASDTVVAADVAKKIAELQKAHPDVELKLIDTMVDYTLGAYHSTMKTLIEGAILAIIVVFIFLRDLRATVIAAIALPLSIIPAFWALDAAGFSLNLVSLLAITIVTGILVDDAIVEIENIVRHMRMGKSAYRAALEAADEIGLAVIAITLTIIAVFVPVSFMGGIAGQYFKQFGLVVAFAVFFSLLVARLITPLLAAYFMRSKRHQDKEGWVLRAYTRLVRWSVAHHYKAVALGLAIFAASIGSFYLLPSGFLPAEDTRPHAAGGRAAAGLAHRRDQGGDRRASPRQIRARPDVKSVFVNGGRVMGGGAEVRKATLVINLVPKDKRKLSQAQIKQEISQQPRRRARHPLLVPAGQRPAPVPAGGLGPRCRRRDACGRRADQPGQAHPADRQRRVDGGARPARAARGADHRHRRRARRLHRGDLGGGAHRHHRRHRRQPRQVRRRRPAGADPRAARGARARRPADAGGAQGGDHLGRGGAAVGGGQIRAGPGAHRHRPLRPHAPRADRRRPGRQHAARARPSTR